MGDTQISFATKGWSIVTGCGPDFQCWERCWARNLHKAPLFAAAESPDEKTAAAGAN